MNSPRTWTRLSSLAAPQETALERWHAPDGAAHDVRVRFGKKLDVFGLKQATFSRFADEVREVADSRRAMFEEKNVEPVLTCPVCTAPTTTSRALFSVYGADYTECRSCAHVYVTKRMTDEAIMRFYGEDEAFAATYTERERAELRVKQVAAPKAAWAIEAFERKFGRKPRHVMDVGAGGGHFVKACRDMGLRADGVEVSGRSRQFAKEYFDVDLVNADWVRDREQFTDVDLVTFWGVVEHVPSPRDFMEATRDVLRAGGMTVVAVPRWTCVSTFVQMEYPETLVRHMDPGGHIHVFSDNSLLTLLATFGFRPTEAWFFGMDTYELLSQIAHRTTDSGLLEKLVPLVGRLQPLIDASRCSDEIVVAGVTAS